MDKMRSVEIRLQDIANELDVSVMTVSRSLRHDTTISPQTRARVHEVARRLGYRGRAGKAQSAVESQPTARSVGLLMRHATLEAAHRDTMLVRMMGGIMSVLDKHDLRLKTHTWPGEENPHFEEDPSAIPPMIQKGECQAVIVQGYHEERNLDFLSHRLPVVSMGRHYRDLPIDAVMTDNVDGVHQLVLHLAELGHRRLAWVGSSVTWSFVEARQAGFLQGCIQQGLEINPQWFFGPEVWDGSQTLHKEAILAAAEAGATAFVCSNDFVAFAVVQHLEAAGKSVPEEVSVTGFDAYGSYSNMRHATSIDPNFFEIGKLAAELTLRRLAQPQNEPCTLTARGKFILGHTTGPASKAPLGA